MLEEQAENEELLLAASAVVLVLLPGVGVAVAAVARQPVPWVAVEVLVLWPDAEAEFADEELSPAALAAESEASMSLPGVAAAGLGRSFPAARVFAACSVQSPVSPVLSWAEEELPDVRKYPFCPAAGPPAELLRQRCPVMVERVDQPFLAGLQFEALRVLPALPPSSSNSGLPVCSESLATERLQSVKPCLAAPSPLCVEWSADSRWKPALLSWYCGRFGSLLPDRVWQPAPGL